MKRIILSLQLLFLAVLVVACSGGTHPASPVKGLAITPVAEIVDNPQMFADGVVTVRGEVSNSMGVFSTSTFTLTDRTGSIQVYCPSSMAPNEGETVRVKGQVRMVFRFRGNSFCYIKQLKNNK